MIINYEYDPNIYQKLKLEKDRNIKNGFYHYIQIQFAYNSNHIEGSTLTPEQTESIFDKGEISGKAKVDEVLETANHYKMFDYLLDTISEPLTNVLIKELHLRLRNGIDDFFHNHKEKKNRELLISNHYYNLSCFSGKMFSLQNRGAGAGRKDFLLNV